MTAFDFDTLRIYFDEDNVALASFDGCRESAGSDFDAEDTPDAQGFEVIIFDHVEKFDGFLVATELLRERDGDIYVWSGELSGRLFGIVVFSREWTDYRFTDLRGERTR